MCLYGVTRACNILDSLWLRTDTEAKEEGVKLHIDKSLAHLAATEFT